MTMADNNHENKVTTKEYWNSVWYPYKNSCAKLNDYDFYYGNNGLFVKLIKKRLGDLDGKSVLELGGGGCNYRLLAMAKWMGASVTAIDYSEEGLRAASDLFKANDVHAHFINEDICEWTPLQRYDIVVHWGVVEHFHDPMPILRKSVEALVPNGTLLFSMPNMESIGAHFWRRWCPNSWSKHVFHSRDLIVSNLLELGLCDVEAFYFGVPFFKMVEWEKASTFQCPVNALQWLGSGSARLFPFFHMTGHRLISMERGFFARVVK